jgi:hypothetical protein
MLFTFGLRMQSEDWGFIRAFIERHLSLRHGVKLPYHWQQTSSPGRDPVSRDPWSSALSFRYTFSLHFANNVADSTKVL